MNRLKDIPTLLTEKLAKTAEKLGKSLEPAIHKYNALPHRDRKVLLYGGTAALLIIFYFVMFEPLWFGYQDMREDIPRTAKLIKRYQEIINSSAEQEKQYKTFESEFNRLLGACFKGDTEALAIGQLSEAMRVSAANAGITLKSSKVEKTGEIKGFQLLNLRIDFESPLKNLVMFLEDIGKQEKEIKISQAKISSRKEEYADEEVELLSVSLLLTGLRFMPELEPGAK